MTRGVVRARRPDAGFTMLEALVATVVMGLILSALAAITATWMPNWSRGLVRVQHNEQIAIALDRLAADLSAAEFISASRSDENPLFEGDELGVTFIRTALGPNTRPGLEFVRIVETADSLGRALVRVRTPFVPLPTGNPSLDPIPFTDPVVLVRAPFRISFAYAGDDNEWRSTWKRRDKLPVLVRFTVRDAASQRALAVSTTTRIHVNGGVPKPQQNPQQNPQSNTPPSAQSTARPNASR